MSDTDALIAMLRSAGLVGAGETVNLTPLTGGVASDIYLAEVGSRRYAVKRALEKLRVAADWRAPTERNAHEVAWLRIANAVTPGCAPEILAHDPASGGFAMSYLDGALHPVWKGLLRDGVVDLAFCAEVGRRIAAIHARTAGDPAVAAAFDTIHIFRPIRLEAYLEAAADRNGDVAAQLMALSRDTGARRIALVHGDVSPKNILAGPNGPVFLDAECAWYGDPAFDPAFCLNHLLLKCLWTPSASAAFLAGFDALAGAYVAGVTWEDAGQIEARIAALLPGLLLARVDGKSPVEYVTQERDRARVRDVAKRFLIDPPGRLSAVRQAWADAIAED